MKNYYGNKDNALILYQWQKKIVYSVIVKTKLNYYNCNKISYIITIIININIHTYVNDHD